MPTTAIPRFKHESWSLRPVKPLQHALEQGGYLHFASETQPNPAEGRGIADAEIIKEI
jgi:hypothetical protein